MSTQVSRVGNYQLDREIGQGGSSKVWLAHHHVLENRQVAVKLMLSDNRETIDRFTREANITSRLKHDCIIQIYDHGFQNPYYYTVMEYVPGSSLRDLLKKREPLPLDLALHIFRRAGSGLDYAHANGVIHRDVSPGNILLHEGQDRVLLTDFGIAREGAKAGITTTQHFMGTPGYLSPEQALSPIAVTHLSDIYSLGIVLYEMLTGKLPWNHLPGISGAKFVPPIPLRERGVNLPSELERILSSLLAPEPNKRYPSAAAAIEELDQVFQRHTSKTMLIAPENPSAPNQRPSLVPRLQTASTPSVMHPVERVLRGDLIKTPILDAQRLYEKLHDYDTMAELLNTWSAEGYFRHRLLGRMAHIHRITNNNIYFYTLRVLFETRDPVQTVEEPDLRDISVPFEKEADRWSVVIAAPPEFNNDIGGELALPGSTRVIACQKCNGMGRIICPRCNGKQRIEAPNPTARTITGKDGRPTNLPTATGVASAIATSSANSKPLLIPCPDCSGLGGTRCQDCATTGRLVQKKITTWHRYTNTFSDHDPMPRVDERWLFRACKPVKVYQERMTDGFREEWLLVPTLEAQITKARQQLNQNTKVILSEVEITLIPANEVTFDLGDQPKPFARFQKVSEDAPEQAADAYSSYIYGFEQKFANDWRFLNWWKVAAHLLGLLLLIVIFLFVVSIFRGAG